MVSGPLVQQEKTELRKRFLGLDGGRGLFMLLFMAYHFGVKSLPGAWIAVNFFFVLSSYLIVSLLINERRKTGKVGVWAFYRRRARRLLPALSVVLVVVALYSWSFQSAADQKQTGGDVLASGAFMLNWRLILRSDDYFGELESPSLLRHLWTLSVEEQFYIVVPFFIGLIFVMKSRRAAIVMFLLIAALSVWRTMSIGVATISDQAHAYYGTDTRVQAFALGAALAVWLPLGSPLPQYLNARKVQRLGAVSLIVVLLGILVVQPMSVFMFEQGGLVLLNLALVILVFGISRDESSGPMLWLSNRFLVWCGARSYGLYLWHWPIVLIASWQLPSFPDIAKFLLCFALTFLVAGISFVYLEQPVMRHGVRGLHPMVGSGRLLVGLTAAAVVIAGGFLSRAEVRNIESFDHEVPSLLAEDAQYVPGGRTIRVAVLGDSVGEGLFAAFDQDRYQDIQLKNYSATGCDFSGWSVAISDVPIEPDSNCVNLLKNLEMNLREDEIDAVLMVGLQVGPMPHFNDHDNVVSSEDPRYLNRLDAALVELKSKAERAGTATFINVTLPCRFGDEFPNDPALAEIRRQLDKVPGAIERYADPQVFNAWLVNWSNRNGVEVLDLYEALECQAGFRTESNGITLFSDHLHFTPEAAAMMWTWMAPRAREIARNAM